jgi:1-acyl-sn-glycerol-3-phosphate acyltransferase
MEKSPHKLKLLEKISLLEKMELWHLDIEDDPESYQLLPSEIDYLNCKFINKVKNKIANTLAARFYDKMIKNQKLIIKEVRGIENFEAVDGGKIVSCNHFSVCDNYAVWVALRDFMHGKMLYKVIREGNYTNPPKPFGLFMRHCNTLPLSANRYTLRKFQEALKILLSRGETVLIYPEQSMWYNYRKPRPLKDGAFALAVKNNVPVIPIFITMEDSSVLDNDGFFVQSYTVNILPAIYPDISLSYADSKQKMKNENYEAWVNTYESFYKKPLVYSEL